MDSQLRDAIKKAFSGDGAPTEFQRKLIRTVAQNPGTPAHVLSDMVWHEGETQAFQRHFGGMCKRRVSMGLVPDSIVRRRNLEGWMWGGLLVSCVRQPYSNGLKYDVYNLLDEARAAFEAIGILDPDTDRPRINPRNPKGTKLVCSPDNIAVGAPPTRLPTAAQKAKFRSHQLVAVRKGQTKFRREVLAAYDGRCAISGNDVEESLEAAHVSPYSTKLFNAVQNGIPLRADLHRLFDRFLIGIDPKSMKVLIGPRIKHPGYRRLHGRKLANPVRNEFSLWPIALETHFNEYVRENVEY